MKSSSLACLLSVAAVLVLDARPSDEERREIVEKVLSGEMVLEAHPAQE